MLKLSFSAWCALLYLSSRFFHSSYGQPSRPVAEPFSARLSDSLTWFGFTCHWKAPQSSSGSHWLGGISSRIMVAWASYLGWVRGMPTSEYCESFLDVAVQNCLEGCAGTGVKQLGDRTGRVGYVAWCWSYRPGSCLEHEMWAI
jgi:hypothetical protein